MPGSTVENEIVQRSSSPANEATYMPHPSTPCPAYRPEHIHMIVDTVSRYDPSNAPILADYVQQQLETNSYDREANLALLKLYQFNPERLDYVMVRKVLTKALTALPDPDFNLCLCLLTESDLANEDVDKLIDLQALLESCSFPDFWARVHGDCQEILDDCPTFCESIRDYIATTISTTFATISKHHLSKFVDLHDEDLLNEFIDEYGWSIDQDVVRIPVDRDILDKKPGQIKPENLKFDMLSKMIAHAHRV